MLKVFSWNIARCCSSNDAENWGNARNFKEIVKRIKAQDADILFLQECPEYFCSQFEDNYRFKTPVGEVLKAISHAPYIYLLIHKRLNPFITSSCFDSGMLLAECQVTLNEETHTLSLASMHLPPFKQGTKKRVASLETLRHHITGFEEEAIHLLGGDTNLRVGEFEKTTLSGCYRDAWVDAGRSKTSKWTWDSFKNKYHMNGFSFRSRYDRIFSLGNSTRKLICKRLEIINGKHESWYLSDHFGILCHYEFQKEGEPLKFKKYMLKGQEVEVEVTSLKTKSNLAVYRKPGEKELIIAQKAYLTSSDKQENDEAASSTAKKRKRENVCQFSQARGKMRKSSPKSNEKRLEPAKKRKIIPIPVPEDDPNSRDIPATEAGKVNKVMQLVNNFMGQSELPNNRVTSQFGAPSAVVIDEELMKAIALSLDPTVAPETKLNNYEANLAQAIALSLEEK